IIKYTVNRPYQYVFTDFIYQYRYLLLALAVGALPLCGMSAYVLQLRRRHMTTTRDNERKLKNITDNINGGVVVLVPNAGLKIVYANEGFLALIQYTKAEHEQLLAQDYVTYVHPQDIDQLNVLVGRMGGETEHISIRLRIVRRDGSYVPTLFNGTIAENADGTKELYCVIMDISEQIRMIEQLDLEQKRYGLIVEKSGEIIYEMDLVRRQALVSLKFLEKFGWSFPKTLLGTDDESLLSLWRVCEADASLLAARTAELLQHHVANVCTVRLCRTDDTALWCEISQYPMLDSQGNLCSVVGRILDVDESMREKEALRRQSRTDPMTGLCNKEAFHEESTAYLATCDARHAAVIFLDLDHFKNVNDTLGHIAGDQVIVDTARQLEMLFSSED
ncbi:MAG: diguanylate cyclase, partial [Clostridia bacterium]